MSLFVVFACIIIGVLVSAGLLDFAKPHRKVMLAKRYVGRLPSGTTAINEQAQRMLYRGLILIAQAVELDQLHDKSNAAALQLLDQVSEGSITAAQLLTQVGALLLQIESEDGLISRLSSNRNQQISTWLDKYLSRKG